MTFFAWACAGRTVLTAPPGHLRRCKFREGKFRSGTSPRDIREQFGFLPGTEVELVVEGEIVRIAPVRQGSKGDRIVEHLRGRATVGMTTDEIMALTRGET